MHRVHVAEQVSVERTTARVVALLTNAQPRWLESLAGLAWREGEFAEGRRSGADSMRRADEELPQHSIKLDGIVEPIPLNTCIDFRWEARCASNLFHELRGTFIVFPYDQTAVLGVVAWYESLDYVDDWGDGSGAERTGTANRPVEVVVRSFLGHLRTALEGF